MEKLELRVSQQNLSTDNETLLVEGLVNKTESWSEMLGTVKRFKEKIQKGVFAKAIKEARTIDFLAEHDKNKILATTANDSLELWENEEGLMMRSRIAPTSYGKDFYTLIKEGIISHMSFGFTVTGQEFRKLVDGTYERPITGLKLLEVSAVRNPAYASSAISARNLEVIDEVDIPDEIEEVKEERALSDEILAEILSQLKANNELLSSLNIQPSKEDKSNDKKSLTEENPDSDTSEKVNEVVVEKTPIVETVAKEEEVNDENSKKETETDNQNINENVEVESKDKESNSEAVSETIPPKEEVQVDLTIQKEILNKVMQGEE